MILLIFLYLLIPLILLIPLPIQEDQEDQEVRVSQYGNDTFAGKNDCPHMGSLELDKSEYFGYLYIFYANPAVLMRKRRMSRR